MGKSLGCYVCLCAVVSLSYGGRNSSENLDRIVDEYGELLGERHWRPNYSKRGNVGWLKKLDVLAKRLGKIKYTNLDEDSKITYKMLKADFKRNMGDIENRDLFRLITSSESPPHLLVDVAFFSFDNKTLPDWQWTVKSLREGSVAIEKLIKRYREGLEHGNIQTVSAIKSTIRSLEKSLSRNKKDSPFRKLPKVMKNTIGKRKEYRKLNKELDQVLEESVFPQYRKLVRFLKNEYLPNAAPLGKDRERYLRDMEMHLGKHHPSPEALSKKGEELLEEIHGEMWRIAQEISPDAKNLRSFVNGLKRRKSNLYASGKELLNKAAEQKEKSYRFAETVMKVPKLKLDAEPLPEVYADNIVAWYLTEEERGVVQFNTSKLLSSQYANEMTSLYTHEILGHHFAYGHSQENEWLSYYRADYDNNVVYDEGWALYIEDLRYQLDDYTPEEKIGYLKNRAWRAARLVVDTGLHTGKMTKAEAIRYFMDATFDNKKLATAEIERYIEWPANALNYMVGNIKFWEIRKKIEKILGKRHFDQIKYHNKLLSTGPIPLDELEKVMTKWANRRKGQLKRAQAARSEARKKLAKNNKARTRRSKSGKSSGRR